MPWGSLGSGPGLGRRDQFGLAQSLVAAFRDAAADRSAVPAARPVTTLRPISCRLADSWTWRRSPMWTQGSRVSRARVFWPGPVSVPRLSGFRSDRVRMQSIPFCWDRFLDKNAPGPLLLCRDCPKQGQGYRTWLIKERECSFQAVDCIVVSDLGDRWGMTAMRLHEQIRGQSSSNARVSVGEYSKQEESSHGQRDLE